MKVHLEIIHTGDTQNSRVANQDLLLMTNRYEMVGLEANVKKGTDGALHHIVVTGDGSNYAIYVDGVSYELSYIIDLDKWFDDTPGLTTYTIGALERASIGNYFNGEIGEVRIAKDKSLTAAVFSELQRYQVQVYQRAPDTRHLVNSGIVYDSKLAWNYDFGNRATYDNVKTNVR